MKRFKNQMSKSGSLLIPKGSSESTGEKGSMTIIMVCFSSLFLLLSALAIPGAFAQEE